MSNLEWFCALLSMNTSQSFNIDIVSLEDLVVFQWIESLWEMLVWWSMILLEWSISGGSSKVRFQLIVEVTFGEKTILWESMVICSWLVIPGVRESSGMGVTHVEWEVGVTIINSIKFSSFHEFQKVVFDNWILCSSSGIGSCDVSFDGISPSKDVFESFMLKSVLVDIDKATWISNSCVNKSLPWSAWSGNVTMSEWMLNGCASINILESSNLFSNRVEMNFSEFMS